MDTLQPRERLSNDGILSILKPQQNHEIYDWEQRDFSTTSSHISRPYFPHNFTDRELCILSFLLGGYISKSILCRVQFRCVCFLLREDGAGSREPGSWTGVPWDLGSDFLLGQGRDLSLVQDIEGEPPGRWYSGSPGFPGARLPQTPLHGPVPPSHPKGWAPQLKGAQRFVCILAKCQALPKSLRCILSFNPQN